MGYTVQWPNERAFVEWRLKNMQPVVDEMRNDYFVYFAAALVSCGFVVAVLLLHLGLIWMAVFGVSEGFFGVRSYLVYRCWLDARTEFRHLCARRMFLMCEEAHAAEVARYEEMARRLGGSCG